MPVRDVSESGAVPGTGRQEGRLALVAGASGHLGGAVAVELARRGWRVGVHYHRGRRRAERVVTEMERARCTAEGAAGPQDPGEALVLGGDLTVRAEAERVVAEFEGAAGAPPRVLVVATGVVRDAPLLRTSEPDWDEVLAANLTAPANILRAAASRWASKLEEGARGVASGGHAILLGSYAALAGRAGGAAYSASKAALIGLARSVARELGPAERGGVRVNVAIPPLVTGGDEAGMGAAVPEEFAGEMRARSVTGRTGDAGDFARFVACLAESEGVSGQVLAADSRVTWT